MQRNFMVKGTTSDNSGILVEYFANEGAMIGYAHALVQEGFEDVTLYQATAVQNVWREMLDAEFDNGGYVSQSESDAIDNEGI